MSEKKAGVVTELLLAARGVICGGDDARLYAAVNAFVENPDGDPDTFSLDDLDTVASWPEELREVVGLVDALPEDARRILPDVLRGLSAKGMAAQVEAQVGATSTAARVAAWAGGLGKDGWELLERALVTASMECYSRAQPGLADRVEAMRAGLAAAIDAAPEAEKGKLQ